MINQHTSLHYVSGAYYKRLVSSNPRVHAVVLNTNLYYHSNDATAGQTDPGGQAAWFDDTMEGIRAAGEKVGAVWPTDRPARTPTYE